MARKKPLPVKEKEKRKKIANQLKKNRAKDRSYKLKPRIELGRWWQKSRGITDYERFLSLSNRKQPSIKQIVKKKLKEKRKKVNVLDVGCGSGVFLSELKKDFKEKINTEGISLARPLTPNQVKKLEKKPEIKKAYPTGSRNFFIKRMEKKRKKFHQRIKEKNIKVHTGLAETHSFEKKFDLIFSVQCFRYTIKPMLALKNTLNHLKKGGEAFLDLGSGKRLKNKKVKKLLKENNIACNSLGGTAFHFVKKLGKKAK